MRSCAAFAIAISFAATVLAQQRLGPIWDKPEADFARHFPQSGYDPFHWNRYAGHWDYVPIPYDPEPPGANYNPFRLNWHSGQWDYVPYPLLSDYDALPRMNDASTFVDTRLDTQQLSARTFVAPPPAPPLPTAVLAPPINPHVQPEIRPTTKPATTPAKPPTKREIELAHLRSTGRWQYNFTSGRWMFVLPGD